MDVVVEVPLAVVVPPLEHAAAPRRHAATETAVTAMRVGERLKPSLDDSLM
jgi:hypothetical protein